MEEPVALSKKERINKIKFIINDLINIPDVILNEMYDKINNMINTKKVKKEVLNRLKKVQFIKSNLENLEDDNIILIEKMTNKEDREDTEIEKLTKIALELINKLLVAIDKQPIQNLSDFKDIHRDDMICSDIINVFNQNKKHMTDNGFDDLEYVTYEKNLKYPHLSMVRCVLKKVNCELKSKNKSKTVEGKRIVSTVYFIQNNINI